MSISSQARPVQGQTANGLFYDRRGTGRPLVLLHGWCLSTRMWTYAQEFFSANFEVVAFDLAGFGRSSYLSGPYTFERYAADLRDAFAELGLQQPLVAGFAFGAAVAVALGKSAPEQLGGIVAVGLPSAQASPYEKMPKAMRRDWPSFSRKSAEALFHNTQTEATIGWIERMFGETELCMAIETVGLLQHYEPTDAVRGLSVPTLFIHADKDAVAPVATGQACVDAVPGSSLAIIENCGHLIVLDSKDAFHDAVENFARELNNRKHQA